MAVRARGEGDLERELAPMESGAYFGEIGLLERIPRTATVESTRASRVLRIEGEQFLDALTNAPASTALLEGARSRLSRTHPSRRSADVAQGRHAGLAAQAEKPLLHDRGDEVAAGGEDAPGGEPPAAGR
jgi:CRP-like cAMP-binding protein